MQLVPNVDLLPPSICFICEGDPDGEAIIDTLYNFKPGVPSVLNGRKYVCERCAKEFGKLFDLVDVETVDRANWERDQARREVAIIRQRLTDIGNAIGDSVNGQAGFINDVPFEDVFRTSALDEVRATNKARERDITEGRAEAKPAALRKRSERPAVPAPGHTVTEEAPVDNVKVSKDEDGSTGTEG